MSGLICFAMAVEDGLAPVIGAAPFDVLARQLPRLIVKRLNGGRDRGIRYFPFIGPVDRRRRFLSVPDLLPVQKLRELAGRSDSGAALLHGRIGVQTLHARIHDAADTLVFDETLPLDPLQPLAAVQRILFELIDVLGWQEKQPALPDLEPPALGHYLVAWDDLLGLEANLVRVDADSWLRGIWRCWELAPEHAEVGSLLLEIAGRLLHAGILPAAVAELLVQASDRSPHDDFLHTAAALLEGSGQSTAANHVLQRIAVREPGREDVTLRLVAHHFEDGDFTAARKLLDAAVQRGNRSPRILAQLSVMQHQLGDHEAQAATLAQLAKEPDLPPGVLRVVAAELAEADRCDEALRLVEQGLSKHPGNAALWLEKARALLRGGDGAAARPALERVLSCEPSKLVRREATRLLRLAHAPETLSELRALDDAFGGGDLRSALSRAKKIVRRRKEMGEAWLLYGIVRQRLSHRRRAIRAFRRALRCMPELGEAHNRLGILLVEAGRYEEGYGHLQDAITLLPWESGPRIHLAQACYYLDRMDEGRDVLAEAERLGADGQLITTVRETFFQAG